VLPDELVLSLGEKVTVVRSFDDGWCIVGRDSVVTPGEIEMGAVPAWSFVKPVKGLKASRPMRTTSLGVTVEIDDRLRRRLRRGGERLRVNVRAYLLSAADDVDAAGDKVRDLCDRAVDRVDSVVATVNDRLDTEEPQRPQLHLVAGREAS